MIDAIASHTEWRWAKKKKYEYMICIDFDSKSLNAFRLPNSNEIDWFAWTVAVVFTVVFNQNLKQ